MFEQHGAKLLPMRAFLARMLRFFALSAVMVGASLALGARGHHLFGNLHWIDALLNASMIPTGMGPVDRMDTAAGKLFAAGYALFSGLAFVTTVAILFAPIAHRLLHALHAELEDADRGGGDE